ncbi:hypothetical protein [Lonsdalea iberica]|uniref:hypothetical protein n=1 Tax=Lonsdalea iberica TaxID=1082703 RepID=UPI00111BE940|nr:hypothetical protein [Lonsdalea iberica]
METVIPPDDSSTINRPDDFELIALMELLSFEDIAFTSINYYLSTMFHSEEPPPPLFISSTGNRRLFINYQGPVDNLEPHDVVLNLLIKSTPSPSAPVTEFNECKHSRTEIFMRLLSSVLFPPNLNLK